MLSRIAESLFWIGRYLERAEDTCRLLDVYTQQLVEDPTVDPFVAAQSLVAVMGTDPTAISQEDFSERQLLEVLCYDPAAPSSVVFALGAARESARRARETVSAEMWEGINTTYLEATSTSFRRRRPTWALKQVRERCATISGIADQTMNHDEGWQFLRLGRSLERADMTARLLASTAINSSPVAWSNGLRACGAHHAFIRLYGGDRVDVAAAEFLLLDRLFPRSVVHSLATAEQALASLGAPSSSRGGAINDRPLRLAGRARADLEYRTAEDLLADLPARMEALQSDCREISDAVNAKYFEVSEMDEWLGGSMSTAAPASDRSAL